METHGVSDADVTKRQLGWYLRNCAQSAFAEDMQHLLAPDGRPSKPCHGPSLQRHQTGEPMSIPIDWTVTYSVGIGCPSGTFTTTIRATNEREAILLFLRNHPHRSVSTVIVRLAMLSAAIADA
jgi:hypothetical protein